MYCAPGLAPRGPSGGGLGYVNPVKGDLTLGKGRLDTREDEDEGKGEEEKEEEAEEEEGSALSKSKDPTT